MTDVNFNKASSAYQNSSNLQSVKNITQVQEIPEIGGSGDSKIGFKPSFNELLTESLDKARDAGYKGEAVSAESVANKAEYHQLVAAVNNMDLSLRTVVAARDKIINAYQDILKMPI
jgi:flagellar hook-basal body complex protein FliE